MNQFAQALLDILRLRAGPEDLPASWTLTLIFVGLHVAFGMFTAMALDQSSTVFNSLIMTALQIFAVAILLKVRGFPERLAQTLLAFAGTGIIIGGIVFGVLLQADQDVNQPLLALVWLPLFIWSLVVDAHIYRNALAISLSQAMLITVLLLAGSYVVVELLVMFFTGNTG